MKKILAILLAILLVFTMTGCFEESGSFNEPSHIHNFSAATCTDYATCSCGIRDLEQPPTGHNFSQATCVAPQTCEKCGAQRGNPALLNHNYVNGTCSVCGKSYINNNNNNSQNTGHVHTYLPATCEEYGKCACGAINIHAPKLGHQYSKLTCTTGMVCSRCGKQSVSALGHFYSNGKCTRCGIKDPNYKGNTNNSSTSSTSNTSNNITSTNNSSVNHTHNFVDGLCSCGKSNRVYLMEDIDYLTMDIYHNNNRIKDNQGVEYSGHYNFFGRYEARGMEYQTNGNYSKFSGTILLPYEDRGTTSTAWVNIYGDGKLLYQSQEITKLFKTENFAIDIKGVNVLKIEFKCPRTWSISTSGYLTNAYLLK